MDDQSDYHPSLVPRKTSNESFLLSGKRNETSERDKMESELVMI